MAENIHKYLYRDTMVYQSETDHDNQTSQNTLMSELKSKNIFAYNEYIPITESVNKESILQSCADEEMRKIIEITSDKSRSFMEIVVRCKVPQTSAYRKIIVLVQRGLLVLDGFVVKRGTKIMRYKSIFKDIKIGVVGNKVTVEVKLARKIC